MDTIHVYGQAHWHDTASIVGTRAALLALRDAIDHAVASGRATMRSFCADGEGYSISVIHVNRDQAAMLARPYFAPEAREQDDSDRLRPEDPALGVPALSCQAKEESGDEWLSKVVARKRADVGSDYSLYAEPGSAIRAAATRRECDISFLKLRSGSRAEQFILAVERAGLGWWIYTLPDGRQIPGVCCDSQAEGKEVESMIDFPVVNRQAEIPGATRMILTIVE